MQYLSPDLIDLVEIVNENTLPAKSKERYVAVYDNFIAWKSKKKMVSISENVLLAYFEEIAAKYKPTSLWAFYSMLKNTMKSKDSINIEEYAKLTAFLKKKSDGYVSKKCKALTRENVEKFIDEAPDYHYLAIKVAVILGVTGGLRREELSKLTINDVEDHDELLLVRIPHPSNKTIVIEGEYYNIVKKYLSLRYEKGSCNRFFQQYRNGKCMTQVIGKNKLGNMPKEIAKYLNLPDAKSYTSHSYRQTSAT